MKAKNYSNKLGINHTFFYRGNISYNEIIKKEIEIETETATTAIIVSLIS